MRKFIFFVWSHLILFCILYTSKVKSENIETKMLRSPYELALLILVLVQMTEQRECFTRGECKESFQVTKNNEIYIWGLFLTNNLFICKIIYWSSENWLKHVLKGILYLDHRFSSGQSIWMPKEMSIYDILQMVHLLWENKLLPGTYNEYLKNSWQLKNCFLIININSAVQELLKTWWIIMPRLLQWRKRLQCTWNQMLDNWTLSEQVIGNKLNSEF